MGQPLRHQIRWESAPCRYKLQGRAPAHVDPNYYDTAEPIRYNKQEGLFIEGNTAGVRLEEGTCHSHHGGLAC